MTKPKITLTKTKRRRISGEPIFKADIGPYKYITLGEDYIGSHLVECLMWCSMDGEPTCAVDSSKFDIEQALIQTKETNHE